MTWDPKLYVEKHSFIFKSGRDALALLAPRAGERILDLGCGTGQLTAAIAESGAQVTGLDSSAAMIEAAQRRFPHLHFVLADGADFHFDEPFDAVFSNAAIHWMKPPEKAVACVAQSLRPGGRFVAQLAAQGHLALIRRAVESASREVLGREAAWDFYSPSIAEFTAVLERCGLQTREARLLEALTKLEDAKRGLRNFFSMFGGERLRAIPEPPREKLLQRIEELARPALFREGGWHVDRRRLLVLAVKS